MLFQVEMTVNIPFNMDKDYVNVLKEKEKAMSQALQRSGKWVDIWRVVGKYANISLFNVENPGELHDILSQLPLFPFMDVKVTALCQHYSAIKNIDKPIAAPSSVASNGASQNGSASNHPSNKKEVMTRPQLDALLAKIESTEDAKKGNPRVKTIVNRIVRDLFYTIEDLDIQPDEFWTAMDYLTQAGQNNEWGLIAPGLGIEHLLDLRMDEAEVQAGLTGGTPRTIEGPLYVAGAPVVRGFARLDDGTEEDKGEIVFMQGQVFDTQQKPIPYAQVEVWHANLQGFYSFFGPPQTPFNLRRTIITDENGRYQFRSIMPSGYAVPPNGSTDVLLQALGRHGNRPAHIHFFVTAKGYRKLTTQVNIDGDPYLWDDFAFGSREGLVPPVKRITNVAEAQLKYGINRKVASIDFNFNMHSEKTGVFKTDVERAHKPADA
jgi:catechol 1,2-dioxygenase